MRWITSEQKREVRPFLIIIIIFAVLSLTTISSPRYGFFGVCSCVLRYFSLCSVHRCCSVNICFLIHTWSFWCLTGANWKLSHLSELKPNHIKHEYSWKCYCNWIGKRNCISSRRSRPRYVSERLLAETVALVAVAISNSSSGRWCVYDVALMTKNSHCPVVEMGRMWIYDWH